MGILGTPLNVLSTAFFLKNKTKSIPNRLLTILSMVDEATILASLVGVLYEEAQYNKIISRLLYFMTVFCCLTSGFITSVLATTRGVVINTPFYVIRPKLLYRIMSVIIIIIATQTAVKAYYFSDIGLGEVGQILFFVIAIEFTIFLLCSIVSGIIVLYNICVREQLQWQGGDSDVPEFRKIQKKVTITILLITGAAVTCNTTVVISYVLTFVLEEDEIPLELINLVLCLNSCVNPVLYIIRNKDIRVFITNIFKLKCDR